jgi:hypothetical protein
VHGRLPETRLRRIIVAARVQQCCASDVVPERQRGHVLDLRYRSVSENRYPPQKIKYRKKLYGLIGCDRLRNLAFVHGAWLVGHTDVIQKRGSVK